MMRAVTSSKTMTESSVQLRSGARSTAAIWKVWVLTLECGHAEVRKAEHPDPPKMVKCAACTKGTR